MKGSYGKKFSFLWFIPYMAGAARAGPGQRQELRTLRGSSTRVCRDPCSWAIPCTAFPGWLAGTCVGSRARRP